MLYTYESNWKSPANTSLQKEEAIVDPIRDHDAEGDQGSRKDDDETSSVWSGTFRLPRRDCTCDHAISDSTYYSASDKRTISKGRSLEDGADDHNQTSPKGGRLATPSLAIVENNYSTEEASYLVDGYSCSLSVRITSTVVRVGPGAVAIDPAKVIGGLPGCHKRNVALKVIEGEQCGENTLVYI